MTTSTTANEAATVAVAEKPEAPRKAYTGTRKPHVAPAQGQSGQQAIPAKKGARASKKATKAKAESVRPGSKTAKVLDLLQRPGGATLKQIVKATGWQAHSVRGFLSGVLGKKMGLRVTSIKNEGADRRYSVKA